MHTELGEIPLEIRKEGRIVINRKTSRYDILVDLPARVSCSISNSTSTEIIITKNREMITGKEGKLWRSGSGGVTLRFRLPRSYNRLLSGIKKIPVRIVIDRGDIKVYADLGDRRESRP